MELAIKTTTTLLINKFDIPLSASSLVAGEVAKIIHDFLMGKEDHDGKKFHIMGFEFLILYAIRQVFEMDTTVWDIALDVGVVTIVDELYRSQLNPQGK